MPDKLIRKLLNEKKLKPLKVGFVQIEDLLKQSILDLEEASKVQKISERAAYLLAYMAMLKAGRALLLLKGYTPSDGAQHLTVVELTSAILGAKYKEITAHFGKMRVKRNAMTYEAGALVSSVESTNALNGAVGLVQGILKEVKIKNPQLELKL